MNNVNEVKRIWNNILERSKKAEYIVLVGAATGTDVQSFLEEHGIKAAQYFDNNDLFVGSLVNGLKVSKPYQILKENVLYIVCVKSDKNKKVLTKQMINLGIKEDSIIYTPKYIRDEASLLHMNVDEMLEDIANIYMERMGKMPNLKAPVAYTEKVNSQKIKMANEKCTMLADKYLVKNYIKETIGEQYVVPLLGVWDRAEEINYDLLPPKFVLKTNHASGRNILVKNKEDLDIVETNEKLNRWLDENYGYNGFALQYRDIKPKIICEEYLDGLAETVYDYQFLCFNGEPKLVWCINGSHRAGCRASFYDFDWNMQPFSFGYPKDDKLAPKPLKLDEMLEISRKLSKGFEHVRVDLYEMPDGRVLFGEMTFQTWGGFRRFYPPEYDYMLGELFK